MEEPPHEGDLAPAKIEEDLHAAVPPDSPSANAGQAGGEGDDEKEKIDKEPDKSDNEVDKGEAGWEPVVLGGPWKDLVDRTPDNALQKRGLMPASPPPDEPESGWSQLKNLQALYEQGWLLMSIQNGNINQIVGFITVTEYKDASCKLWIH